MSDSFDIELMKRKSETKKTMRLLQEDLMYAIMMTQNIRLFLYLWSREVMAMWRWLSKEPHVDPSN